MMVNSLLKKVVSAAVSVAIVGMSVPVMAASGEDSVQTQAEPNRVATKADNASNSDTFTVDNIVYTISDEAAKTCYVSGNTLSVATDVAIPAKVTNPDSRTEYNVTSIGKDAFADPEGYRGHVKGITIPDSVTSIGEQAFYGCPQLKSINISQYVTSIGEGAFGGCCYIDTINVAKENTHYAAIGGVLFKIDSNKTPILLLCSVSKVSYEVPSTVERIGNYAFFNCDPLKSITISNGVKEIGYGAFNSCGGLTNIAIPDSVTSIEDYAFYICTELKSVTIGSGVTSIGESVFQWCGLTSITIPDSVTSIGKNAFYYCCDLTSITIPDSVTSIGEGAFAYCYGLKSVTIPDSVTSIGEGAFSECYNEETKTGLESVTIGSGVKSIGDSAFCNSDELKYVLFATDRTDTTWGEGVFEGTKLAPDGEGGYFHASKAVVDDLVSRNLIAANSGDPITGLTPPTVAPSNVTAKIQTSSKATANDVVNVQVSWDAVTDGTVYGYQVQRSLDGGATWENVGEVTTENTAIDTVASDDIDNVTYKVAGVNQATVAGGDAGDPFDGYTVDSVGVYSDPVGLSYNITYSYDKDQGTVTGAESAQKDVAVAFTVTPKEGYTVKEVTSNVAGLEIKDNGNGNYSFTMPTSDVAITVDFEQVPSPSPTPTPTPDDGGGTGGGGTGGGANTTGTSYSSGNAKTGDNAMADVVGLTALVGLGVVAMLRRRRK